MKKNKETIIFGRNPVREALNSNRVKTIYLNSGFSHNEILSLISRSNLKINYTSTKELDSLSGGGVHQGVVAIIKDYEYWSLDSVLEKAKKQERPVFVILDGIEDTHNLGAILRCADIFDVTAVIISKHNQVPLNATVAKTSAGAINYVPVCLVGNLNQTITRLKEEGFWVVSTDGSAQTEYQQIKYDFKVALVIGSEGQGVSRLILSNSDYIVKIPQYGHVNSLNASVAAGILLAKIRER